MASVADREIILTGTEYMLLNGSSCYYMLDVFLIIATSVAHVSVAYFVFLHVVLL